MPGHNDWDINTIWRDMPIVNQQSGNYPAAATVLYSGAFTSWPALQILIDPTAGGVQVEISWYVDAALSQLVGSDIFDADSNQGVFIVYESEASFVSISVRNVTTSPAGAGKLVIVPTRGQAFGVRAKVTPQVVLAEDLTVAASHTSIWWNSWITFGQIQLKCWKVSVANAVTVSIYEQDYSGAVVNTILENHVMTATDDFTFNTTGLLLYVHFVNSTTAAAVVGVSIIGAAQE